LLKLPFAFFFSLFCAFSLFCSGCSPSYYTYNHASRDPYLGHRSDIPVYVDEGFSPAEKQAIVRSINEWNEVLNGYITIRVSTWHFDRNTEAGLAVLKQVAAAHQGIVILDLHDNDPLLEDNDTDGVLAFVDGLGRQAHLMVVLSDHIGNRDLKTILMHEWGHALGAQHTTSRSLMHNFYDGDMQASCIDRATVLQVSAYQHLNMEHLNYCIVPD
jgi:Matrixin